ncbi:MAG TPA: hypothetical protein VGF25_12180, partial [Thermoleophilaceae bacterium]
MHPDGARRCSEELALIRAEQLAAALERLDPRDRELLELSLHRRVPDEALGSYYACAPAEVARRRAAAIERLADDLSVQRGGDLGAVLRALLEPATWAELKGEAQPRPGEEFARAAEAAAAAGGPATPAAAAGGPAAPRAPLGPQPAPEPDPAPRPRDPASVRHLRAAPEPAPAAPGRARGAEAAPAASAGPHEEAAPGGEPAPVRPPTEEPAPPGADSPEIRASRTASEGPPAEPVLEMLAG